MLGPRPTHCEPIGLTKQSIPDPGATNFAMVSFMKGLVTGDSNVANDGLRRFFEQRFHEGSESCVFPHSHCRKKLSLELGVSYEPCADMSPHNNRGLRQHAMLNLARMYFLRRELAACRKVGGVVIVPSSFLPTYSPSLDP